ncbi:hypothetical protein BN439_0421 [Erwinia amylovora Ea644]|nr:hypothetical protein BN439_0421 [Erwinia amylovora Ea644]
MNLGKIYEQQVELVQSLDDAYQIVLKKFPSEIASKRLRLLLIDLKSFPQIWLTQL